MLSDLVTFRLQRGVRKAVACLSTSMWATINRQSQARLPEEQVDDGHI